MGLFLGWLHKLICIVLSLCKHACKKVCDIKPGIDLYPLLAWSCNRWWPDFVTFTACKKSKFGFKRGKKAQCVSKRCKDSFQRKKYFEVRCTLNHFLFLQEFKIVGFNWECIYPGVIKTEPRREKSSLFSCLTRCAGLMVCMLISSSAIPGSISGLSPPRYTK